MPVSRNQNLTGNTNDPRYASTQERVHNTVQTIPEPTEGNIVETVLALKEAMETMIGLRGDVHNISASFQDLEDLGLITINPGNGDIKNNVPFGAPKENSLASLKYCDGVTEDFGSGEGWYFKKSTGWEILTTRGENVYDFIVPASTTITDGGTPVGTVTDLQTLNDGNVYQVPEVIGTPGFDIKLNFSSVKRLSGIVTNTRYVGTASHDITIGLWNYVTAAYDRLLLFSHTDTYYTYRTVLIPDDTNYISSGNAQIVIYHETSGNQTHNIYIDYAALLGATG